MEVPRSWVNNYTDNLNEVTKAAQDAALKALSRVNYSADPAEVRRAVVAIMDEACSAAGAMSARVSADFYDGLRERVVGERLHAKAASGWVREATEKSVRAFLQKIFEDEDEDAFLELCSERIDYEVKRSSGRSIRANVAADDYEDGVRYARVPTGLETCEWCLMLASRGPVYLTEESAGAFDHWHPHCDCRVVPFWGTFAAGTSRRRGAMSIEGYDPDELYRQYRAAMESKL